MVKIKWKSLEKNSNFTIPECWITGVLILVIFRSLIHSFMHYLFHSLIHRSFWKIYYALVPILGT